MKRQRFVVHRDSAGRVFMRSWEYVDEGPSRAVPNHGERLTDGVVPVRTLGALREQPVKAKAA